MEEIACDIPQEVLDLIADLKTEVSRLKGQLKQQEYTLMDMFAQSSMQSHRLTYPADTADNLAEWAYKDAKALCDYRLKLFEKGN